MYLVQFVYFVIWRFFFFFFFIDVMKLCKVKDRHHLGYFCTMNSMSEVTGFSFFVPKEKILIAVIEQATPCSAYSAHVVFPNPSFNPPIVHNSSPCHQIKAVFPACQRVLLVLSYLEVRGMKDLFSLFCNFDMNVILVTNISFVILFICHLYQAAFWYTAIFLPTAACSSCIFHDG